jgi:hypothetical protein
MSLQDRGGQTIGAANHDLTSCFQRSDAAIEVVLTAFLLQVPGRKISLLGGCLRMNSSTTEPIPESVFLVEVWANDQRSFNLGGWCKGPGFWMHSILNSSVYQFQGGSRNSLVNEAC